MIDGDLTQDIVNSSSNSEKTLSNYKKVVGSSNFGNKAAYWLGSGVEENISLYEMNNNGLGYRIQCYSDSGDVGSTDDYQTTTLSLYSTTKTPLVVGASFEEVCGRVTRARNKFFVNGNLIKDRTTNKYGGLVTTNTNSIVSGEMTRFL